MGKSARVRKEIDVLRWRTTLVTCTALLVVLVILFSTRWGAALGDDSYSYIKPVRDTLSGVSFRDVAVKNSRTVKRKVLI